MRLIPGRKSLIRYAEDIVDISREATTIFNTYFAEEPRVDHIVYSARRRETIDKTSAVIIGDNNQLWGYIWAWNTGRRNVPKLVYPRIRYSLPPSDKKKVLETLLAWTRKTIGMETRKIRIVTGPLDLYTRHLLQTIIRSPINWQPETHLVVLENIKQHTNHVKPSKEIQLEKVDPRNNNKVLKEIVEIYNDSFLDYPEYSEWKIDEAKHYYEKLYTWSKPIVIIARRNREAVGYAEAYTHNSATGISGLVTTIAVKKKYRKQGYGKLLLEEAEEELLGRGAQTVYLYAEDPVLGFYKLHGYRVVYTSYNITVYIDELPIDIYYSVEE